MEGSREKGNFSWIEYAVLDTRETTSQTGILNCKLMGSPINLDVSGEKVCKEEPLPTEEHAHYGSIVGSLLHISTKSRANIASAASMLDTYVFSTTTVNMAQAERTLRYLRWTEEKTSKMKPGYSNQL